jgi:hypothetical protein
MVRLKDVFWCRHFERGLIFPSTCMVDDDFEEGEVEEDDGGADTDFVL